MYRKTTSDSIVIKDWTTDIPGALAPDGKTFMFPVIKSPMRTGKMLMWLITVRIYPSTEYALEHPDEPLEITDDIASNENKDAAYIARVLVYSRIGSGQCSEKEPTFITKGKSIGRANETNVYCQALRHAFGLYNKHRRHADTEAEVQAPTAAAATDPCAQLADANTQTDIAHTIDEDARSQVARPRPMLASYYTDVFAPESDPTPLYVQRKYNGVRAVGTYHAPDAAILYSRTGLLYEGFTALKEDIRAICEAWNAREIDEKFGLHGIHPAGELFIDGELYYHGAPLQIISGTVRRKSALTAKPIDRTITPVAEDFADLTQHDLSFVMYDLFIVNKGSNTSNSLTFDERFAIMRAISRWNDARNPAIRLRKISFAETATFVSKPGGGVGERAIDYALELYARFLGEHYEGAIFRLNTPYEHSVNGRHSKGLLKMKPVHDAEFTIVGFTLGENGRARGALLFTCEVSPGGARFNVTPTGTVASRIALATEFARVEDNGNTVFENEWLGKPLIVHFDELSPAGVPQRARTDGTLRTYE